VFNIGGGELIVIALVALVVLGPNRLPGAARKVGEVLGDLRRISSGFQNEIRTALDDAEREAARADGASTGAPSPAALAPATPAEGEPIVPTGGAEPLDIAGALASVSAQGDPAPEPVAPTRAPATTRAAKQRPAAKKAAAAKRTGAAKKTTAKKTTAKTTTAKKTTAKRTTAKTTGTAKKTAPASRRGSPS
jgi:Tat protein translocase TatB subunit